MHTHIAKPISALLAGALFAAWLLFAPLQLGGQAAFIIVNGNSMEPLYHRGDLVIIRSDSAYRVGDVVTYAHPQIGPVIHRIIGRDGERWVFQGDHNTFVDPYRPLSSELIGRAWISLPRVGGALMFLRQSPPLLALLLGGGGLLMLITPTTRRRGRGGRVAGGAPGGARAMASSLLGVLALAALAVAGMAFTRPISQEVVDTLSYSQQGSFRYSADAPPGIYDSDSVRSGDPVFRQLSRALSVDFDYQFASAEPADLRGSYGMSAVLSSQNGWRRTLALVEAQPIQSAQIALHAELELSRLKDLIAQFEAQTGLDRQQYTLAFVPSIVIEGELAGAPLRDSFAPRLEFDIDALQIQLLTGQGGTDVLRPVQAGEIRLAGVGPNSMSILGLQLDVALAREGGLIAAVVAAGLAAMAALPLLWSARSSEHARIALRYGAMMIDVADQPSLRAARVVRIGSFGDLAKLAERHGALIMRDGPALAPRYIVQQGDTAYIYGALAPEATAPQAAAEPAPSEAPDPAEAPDPGVTQLWQERFLQALRESGMAADACRSIGVDIVTAYRERERSSEFAQAWNDARLTAWQQRTLKGQSR